MTIEIEVDRYNENVNVSKGIYFILLKNLDKRKKIVYDWVYAIMYSLSVCQTDDSELYIGTHVSFLTSSADEERRTNDGIKSVADRRKG